MSAPAAGREPLGFRGGPLRVSAVLPGGAAPTGPATARLTPVNAGARGAGTPAEVEPVVIPFHDRVMMQLPRDTPPGTYRGVLTLGGVERPIVAEVEPRVFLRAAPPSLELTGGPRQRVTATMVLMNRGNVAVEVGRAHAFSLFDEGGIECAIGRAAVARLRPGERRIDRFADALAEMHGGLVRMSVDPGKGPVQPGETRALRLSLTVPERLQPGHAYSGSWALHNFNYSVRITVPGGAAGGKEAQE
jgi:hypothetical protein